MPKLIKFKGQRSQDRIRHILIFDDKQNVHFTFCEKRPILFTKSLWFHVSVNQCCRSAPVREIYTSGGPRTVAARWLTYHPGPFRGPRGRGKAAGRHPRIPYGSHYIILTKIGKRNRAVTGRLLAGPRAGPLCNIFTFRIIRISIIRWYKFAKTDGNLFH